MEQIVDITTIHSIRHIRSTNPTNHNASYQLGSPELGGVNADIVRRGAVRLHQPKSAEQTSSIAHEYEVSCATAVCKT